MRTGLDGNGCADAPLAAASTAAPAANIRNQLATTLFTAFLPIFLLPRLSHVVTTLIARPRGGGPSSGAGHGYGRDMLTIPGIASSFGASIKTIGGHVANETSSRGKGRIRWRSPRPKPGPNLQVKPAGTAWCCK